MTKREMPSDVLLSRRNPEARRVVMQQLRGPDKAPGSPVAGNGAADSAQVTLVLPYPPSVNHYWGRTRTGRMFVSAKGHEFRQRVKQVVFDAHCGAFTGLVEMCIDLHPPDRRKRDADNPIKALWDALQHAGIIHDDYQIEWYRVWRHKPVVNGLCTVTIQASAVTAAETPEDKG